MSGKVLDASSCDDVGNTTSSCLIALHGSGPTSTSRGSTAPRASRATAATGRPLRVCDPWWSCSCPVTGNQRPPPVRDLHVLHQNHHTINRTALVSDGQWDSPNMARSSRNRKIRMGPSYTPGQLQCMRWHATSAIAGACSQDRGSGSNYVRARRPTPIPRVVFHREPGWLRASHGLRAPEMELACRSILLSRSSSGRSPGVMELAVEGRRWAVVNILAGSAPGALERAAPRTARSMESAVPASARPMRRAIILQNGVQGPRSSRRHASRSHLVAD